MVKRDNARRQSNFIEPPIYRTSASHSASSAITRYRKAALARDPFLLCANINASLPSIDQMAFLLILNTDIAFLLVLSLR
jgi:hypothetical protein